MAVCIGFSALANAAHDLWAACIVFSTLSVLTILFILDHYRSGQPIRLPLIGPVALLLAVFAISSHSSYDFPTSRLECWVWFFSFVGFYLFLNTVRTPAELRSFMRWGSSALIPITLLDLCTRTTPLINPNVLTGFALYWVFFLWHEGWKGFSRVAMVAIVLTLLLGRSSWAAFSLIIGFIYYYQDKLKTVYFQRKSLFIILSAVVVCGCTGTILFKLGMISTSESSDANRLLWWAAALQMMARHPFGGVGLGAYATAYPYFRTGTGLNSLFVHSFPFQLMSETGLIGVAAFFVLVGSMARRIRQGDAPSETRKIFLTTAITVLFYSLVEINMEYFLNKIMLLFILAPLLSERENEKKLSGFVSATALLAVLLLVPSWLAPWKASVHAENGARFETQERWPEARASYLQALALDPACADAYAGLAHAALQANPQGRSAADLSEWRSDMFEAIRWKKSSRFLAELQNPNS